MGLTAMRVAQQVDEIRLPSVPVAMDFAPDGRTLAVALESWRWKKAQADAPQIVLYNPVDGRELGRIRRKGTTGYGVAYAGGKLFQLVRGVDDADAALWVSEPDLTNSKSLATWDFHDLDARALVRDRSGRWLAVVGRRIEVWDAIERKRVWRFGGEKRMDSQVHFPELGAALGDGRPWIWIAGSEPGRIVLHDFRLGTEIASWPAPYRQCGVTSISPDLRVLVAYGENDYGARVVDTVTGALLLEDEFPVGRHLPLSAITGDGRLLVRLDYGGVKAWTLPDAKPLKGLPKVTGEVACAAAADGAPLVAFGAKPDRVLVLDVLES